jgi:tryptophan halogenase
VSDQRIRDVVIVGGGTAGWMAAAAFSRFLNNGHTRITLIESDAIGTIGVGEATIPPIQTFNRMLGLNENEMLAATQGTFKLGVEFVDWGRKGQRYLHPFGFHGHELHGIAFHQLWLRERQRRVLPDIAEYTMSGAAARRGKFARPSREARSPVADINYAFHFDAGLYAQFLRRYAERGGVTRIEGRVVSVAQRGADGFVESVTTEDKRTVAGDLFIDCSGFRGLLIEQTLKTGYEDWAHWLPCNRAIAVQTERTGPPDPFTRATAHAGGWQWRIPLQHRMGNGFVYSTAFTSDDEAAATLMANLEGPARTDPRTVPFTTGRRKQAWTANVVSLGLSSGFIEPLESTSIHMIQAGIARLIALFPDKRFDPAERAEYNRAIRELYEDVRDFIVLHFHATTRDDSPLWDYCRTMEIPDSLAAKIALWRGKARSFRDGLELFATPSWVSVLLGQNIEPAGYDPIADSLDLDKVAAEIDRIHAGYARTAEALPDHGEFVARCTAPEAMPTAAMRAVS